MATSRRTGVNENISTFGDVGCGRDYTDLMVWEAATDYNLVSATTSEVLECYADASSYDEYIWFVGATTNSSYRRILRPASGQGHNGTPNTGVRIHNTTDIVSVYFNESYSQINDIVGKSTPNNSNERAVIMTATNAFYNIIVGCIVYDSDNQGTGNMYGIYLASGGIGDQDKYQYVANCLVHNVTDRGVFVKGSCYKYVYNCTATDSGANFHSSIGFTDRAVATNGCASGSGTEDWVGSWVKTTCTEDGANPSYVDSANDDFHLASGDTVCRGNGTDLSGDSAFAFDDDIDFETRAAWDIGFDEFSGAEEAVQPSVSIMT